MALQRTVTLAHGPVVPGATGMPGLVPLACQDW